MCSIPDHMDTDVVKEKTQLVYKILHILTKSLPRKDVTQYHKTEQCTCNNLLAHFLLSVFCVSVEQKLGKEDGRKTQGKGAIRMCRYHLETAIQHTLLLVRISS